MKILYLTDNRTGFDKDFGLTNDNVNDFCLMMSIYGDVTVGDRSTKDANFLESFDITFLMPTVIDNAIFIRRHSNRFFLDMCEPPLLYYFRENTSFLELINIVDGILCARAYEYSFLNRLAPTRVFLRPMRIRDWKKLSIEVTDKQERRGVLIYVGLGGDMGDVFPVTLLIEAAASLDYKPLYFVSNSRQQILEELLKKCGVNVIVKSPMQQEAFFRWISQLQGIVVPAVYISALNVIPQSICLRTPIWCCPNTGFAEMFIPQLIFKNYKEIGKYHDVLSVMQKAYDAVDILSYEHFIHALHERKIL